MKKENYINRIITNATLKLSVSQYFRFWKELIGITYSTGKALRDRPLKETIRFAKKWKVA